MTALLEIRGLQTSFQTDRGTLRSVDGIDLDIGAGETLGLVGESGCGKSVTALSIMRLVPTPPGRIAGAIRLDGVDLLALDEAAMTATRGDKIAMIYQEPMTALNPVHRVGDQIAEAITAHRAADRDAAWRQAIDLLRLAGIASPELRAHEYPHQLSGGMRQRVMIAMALACRPRLLIADEPTTALDVTIQAQILALIARLKAEIGMAVLLITHDLGVVAETCDRVAVMYAGRIVEEADVFGLFAKPLHPYSEGLIASIPRLDEEREELRSIPGNVPNPLEPRTGCRFAPRCPEAFARCHAAEPEIEIVAAGRRVACFKAAERLARAEVAR